MPETKREKITKSVVDRTTADPTSDVTVWDTLLKGFRLRVRPSGRKVYEVRYRIKSRQRLYTIGTHGSPWTPDQARAEALKVLAAAETDIDRQDQRREERRASTVSELIDDYLKLGPAEAPEKRQSSWNTDAYNLNRHARPLLGMRIARDLTKQELIEWRSDVTNGKTAYKGPSGKKRGVINVRGGAGAAARALRTLQAMLEWAEIPNNPAKQVIKIKDGQLHRYLTSDEASSLWQSVDELEGKVKQGISPAHAAVFRLTMLTGARRGEILGLKWSEVDFAHRMIFLPPNRHKTGKQNKPRAIPLPVRAVEILQSIPRIKSSTHVFSAAGRDAPMSPPKRAWDRIRQHSGVTDAGFQVLRHSFASFAVADGVGLYILGKALGHTNASTTQRYAHLRDDAAAAVTESASARYTAPKP